MLNDLTSTAELDENSIQRDGPKCDLYQWVLNLCVNFCMHLGSSPHYI